MNRLSFRISTVCQVDYATRWTVREPSFGVHRTTGAIELADPMRPIIVSPMIDQLLLTDRPKQRTSARGEQQINWYESRPTRYQGKDNGRL